MAIQVACPRCGNPITAPDRPSGEELCCFHCGATVVVKSKRTSEAEAATPPPLPSELEAEPENSLRSSPLLKSAMLLLGAFALGVLLCGVFLAGFVVGRATGPVAKATAAPAEPVVLPHAIVNQPPAAATRREETLPEEPAGKPAAVQATAAASSNEVAALPKENVESGAPPTNDVVDAAGAESKSDSSSGVLPEKQEAASADPALPPGMRNWSDSTGKFNVLAQFVSFDDKLVRLRKQDEEVVAVPIDRLSDGDQEFVLRQAPEPSIDLPPGEGPVEEAPEDFGPLPVGDPNAPLFGNAESNPPPRTTGRTRPRLKYPDAQPRLWTPYSHKPFYGVFHDLEAARLSIRIEKGIVLHGPVLDMSPEDLEYIKQIMGPERFEQEVGAPPAAFAEPARRAP
jgi:hypothetical protein